jgi:hypothetical protein
MLETRKYGFILGSTNLKRRDKECDVISEYVFYN